MKCSACQSDNRDGVKFCEECGTEIAIVCPRCDSRIPVGKKYCGMCGEKLAQGETVKKASAIDYDRPDSYTPKFMAQKILTTRSSLVGERKLVTVFFADVAGFTTLSEELDPETVHQIMDGCFKILMDEIHKYEGTINQFTGDGVMALFGAPLAHEDHAQRACHAALGVQKSLAQYGQKVKGEFGPDFKMRIGLNSGPVVVGAIGDDLRMDYTAVGDTTNLAARMESMAGPGEILVSDKTYRLVEKYFLLESFGEMPIKGKKEPQAVHKLISASDVRSRLEASEARGLIQYVGRKEETSEFLKVYEKVLKGRGQVLGIVGEAGIGKSRFVFEMHRRMDDHCRYVESRCIQYGSNIPFLPILESFKSYFGISEGETEEEIVRKLERRLADLDKELLPSLPAFRDFLSLPVRDREWESLDPKEKRGKTFEAIRDLLIRLSQDAPLILVVDDLQWMDKTSEEFISYFIEWIANVPILLLLLYRQEYSHPWGSKSFYRKIGIYQLSEDESRQFIGYLMKDGDIDPQVEDLIMGRTSGNPLFMEELTHTLMENGSILKRNNKYQLSKGISELQVPDSIQGIIAGRMDRLEDNIKNTMQMASVIGRNFLFKILQAITGLRDEIKGYLLRLQSLEFIYEKQIFPELEYIFKNVVTQEVAYNSLLLNRRREIHGSIGRAIEAMYPNQTEEFYEVIAHHYSKSDHHERAYKYLKLSGDKAIRNNSAWEAFLFYKKALGILKEHLHNQEQQPRQLALLHSMMSPIILLGFPEGTLEILEEGVAISKELEDQKSLIRFYSNMGFFHSVRGRHEEGLRYSGKAFEEATAINDITAMAQTAPDLCLSNFAAGQYETIIHIASRMIHALRKAGKERDTFGGPAVVYPTLISLSGYSLAHLGRFEEGMSHCLYGLEEAEQTESLFTKCLGYYYPGMALLLKGDWKAAKDYLVSCIDGFKQVKFIQIEAIAKGGLGVAEAYLGDPKLGRNLAEESLTLLQEAGIEWQISMLKCFAGMCCHESGDPDGARRFFDEALAVASKNNEVFCRGKALIWGGRILGSLSEESVGEAEQRMLEGIEILSELGAMPEMSIGKLFLGELYAKTDRRQASRTHLTEAATMFREMGMEYWLEKTNASAGG